MTTKMKTEGNQKYLTREVIALRKLREDYLKIDRKTASSLLEMTTKNLEKYENGRGNMTFEKLSYFLSKYKFSQHEFDLAIDGKFDDIRKLRGHQKAKVVENNNLRRSYKTIITKEVLVLKCLRELRGVNQYQASKICKYPRCTIGHIEQGRITLSPKRIQHIVESYSYTMDDFMHQLKSDNLLNHIVNECIALIKRLPEEKLLVVQPMLVSFSN